MNHNQQLATLFVGIDVSSKTNYFYACDFYDRKLLSFPASNNQPGTESAINSILQCLALNKLQNLVVIMESTGFYSWHIANSFSQNPKLNALNSLVYCINPKVIANYKKTFVDIDKTDPLDAMAIADYARVGRVSSRPWRGTEFTALQRLTRQRLHIVENLAREKNYMLTNIFLKFSELTVLDKDQKPFSNDFGATSLAVVTEIFSTEDIANMSIEDLVDFIVKHGKNRFSNPIETATLLQKAARDSYRLDKALTDPINVALAISFDQIKFLEKQLKSLDKVIERTVKGLRGNEYTCLSSIKGIGPVFAAGIIAEIGDVENFSNQAALAKYAGLTWRKHQSGNFTAQDTFLTKTGNKYLRYYLLEAASQVIKYDPEYKAFYQRKYNEVSKSNFWLMCCPFSS